MSQQNTNINTKLKQKNSDKSELVPIDISKIHKCDKHCAYDYTSTMKRIKNPNYDGKKCEKYGEDDDSSLRIVDCNKKSNGIIIDGDEKVISDNKIKIIIKYPLKQAFEFLFESNDGFTRMELLQLIGATYKHIYKAEQTTKPIYGIFGHSIGELFLEQIMYDKTHKIVHLSIGS